MSDPLMDWLERNNPDMARVLHDERYFNSEAIERLQAQLDAVRALVESAFQVIASDESTLLRENWLKEHQELEAKLKEAGDE